MKNIKKSRFSVNFLYKVKFEIPRFAKFRDFGDSRKFLPAKVSAFWSSPFYPNYPILHKFYPHFTPFTPFFPDYPILLNLSQLHYFTELPQYPNYPILSQLPNPTPFTPQNNPVTNCLHDNLSPCNLSPFAMTTICHILLLSLNSCFPSFKANHNRTFYGSPIY